MALIPYVMCLSDNTLHSIANFTAAILILIYTIFAWHQKI